MHSSFWTRIVTVTLLLLTALGPTTIPPHPQAYAYNLTGYRWYPDSEPVHVYFDDTIPSRWLPSLKAVVEQYNAVNSSLSLVYGGLVNGVGIQVSGITGSEWTCTESRFAYTYFLQRQDSRLIKVLITLNYAELLDPSLPKVIPTQHYPSDAFIHEMGHAVGLGHVLWPPSSVMYCLASCEFAATSLGDDDKQALRALYGAPSGLNSSEVNSLYQQVFCRNADPSGLASYANQGLTEAQLRDILSNSPEGQRVAAVRQLYIELLFSVRFQCYYNIFSMF